MNYELWGLEELDQYKAIVGDTKMRTFHNHWKKWILLWCMSMPHISSVADSVFCTKFIKLGGAKKYYTNIYEFEYTLVRKRTKKICGLRWDNTQEKLEHIKRSHRREASEQFSSLYNVEMNKTCKVCQNTRPFHS